MSVFKSEFIVPTYQPTTITLRISINSTLFSLSIVISGGMRVHFMKESVPSQTFQCGWTPPPEEFWKPARPPSHHAPGLRYIAGETPCSDHCRYGYSTAPRIPPGLLRDFSFLTKVTGAKQGKYAAEVVASGSK